LGQHQQLRAASTTTRCGDKNKKTTTVCGMLLLLVVVVVAGVVMAVAMAVARQDKEDLLPFYRNGHGGVAITATDNLLVEIFAQNCHANRDPFLILQVFVWGTKPSENSIEFGLHEK
jgi:hypothetical protein